MKRLFALLGLALGLALAQAPAYPENTLGLGYAPDKGFYLQGSALLPFNPLGIDTGLDAQVLLSQSPEVYALLKANLFPGLVLADLYTSLGLGLDLRYPFGVHLGPVASVEVPGGALSLGSASATRRGSTWPGERGLGSTWSPWPWRSPPPTATPSSSPSSTSGSPVRKKLPLLLFSLPALLPLFLFVLYPFLDVLRFSTWDWSGLSEPRPVGLENYRDLLRDPAFWNSLLVTLKFMLLALPLFVGLSVALAVALEGMPYERLAKSLLFLPGLVTLGGATLSWYTLFTPEYGALAQFLPIPPWDREGFWALLMVVAFTLWRHLGYGVLVASARLKAIPKTLLEAAYVDGAGPFEAFRHVVLPLMRPAVAFLVVVGTILALQSYAAVFLLDPGGPVRGHESWATTCTRWALRTSAWAMRRRSPWSSSSSPSSSPTPS